MRAGGRIWRQAPPPRSSDRDRSRPPRAPAGKRSAPPPPTSEIARFRQRDGIRQWPLRVQPHLPRTPSAGAPASPHSICLTRRAGFPATIVRGGTSAITTALEATIASSPIVTPFMIALLKPTQQPRPIEPASRRPCILRARDAKNGLEVRLALHRIGRMAVIVEHVHTVSDKRHVPDRDVALRADDHVVADIDGVSDRTRPPGSQRIVPRIAQSLPIDDASRGSC